MQTPNHSFTRRGDLLARMRSGDACDWDIIIVGGGITGAGVLREAVRRGYRALLIEQKDFAWGTSSRSSKMVHGGLRYLGSGDLKLTRHSLKERERLLTEAPGLVDRADFYFALRKGIFPGRWSFSILLWIYDRIAGVKSFGFCDSEQSQKKFEGLAAEGLTGTCYYADAITDDARLVLRVLQESVASGGNAINYTRVNKLLVENGEVSGVVVEDTEDSSGEMLSLRAPVVINATGAWADKLRNHVNKEKRVRPLRGSHLVLPRACLPVPEVLSFFHPVDKRSVFVFPWEGATAVGTTDLDHEPDLDSEASITEAEVEYLLEAVNTQFPQKNISRGNVISTWAGVRPVIGSEKSKDPSRERRDHAVWSDQGLITVSGGKLTTFRLIALDALAAAQSRLPDAGTSDDERVFSAPDLTPEALIPADATLGQRLLGRYGAVARDLLDGTKLEEQQRIDGTNFSLAECRWALRHEAVHHLDDLLLRRTRLGLLLRNGGEQLFDALQNICADELGWDQPQWERELTRYRLILHNHYSLPARGDINESS
ncbi:MAG: glycerol-3-phosphate dehydrogenase [Halieaceae bacterium]|jgi:glycerol-3-phosphate dehydrogenase